MFTRAHTRAMAIGALSAAFLLPCSAVAQNNNSFDDAITPFSARDVRGYVQPLSDALISNLSAGYFYSSGPRYGFGLSVELVAMGTSISDKMRTYTAHTPVGFNPSTITAPTVFGGKASPVSHATVPSISYRTSDGVLNADMLPLALPQIRAGGILGSEVVVRYFDSDLLGSAYPSEDVPKVNLLGVGVRHSVSQYFVGLPLEITISGSYNSVTFGEYAELKGTTYGAAIGKNLGLLSVTAGVESAGGTMNLAYTSTNEESPGDVDIDIETKRHIRTNAGAMLNLSFLKIFGTAAFGDVTTYSAGLRFGF